MSVGRNDSAVRDVCAPTPGPPMPRRIYVVEDHPVMQKAYAWAGWALMMALDQ